MLGVDISIWNSIPQELRVVVLGCLLFFLYILLNMLVKHTHGIRYSPYFHVLYADKFRSDPNHAIAFAITVSFAFLIAVFVSYFLMLVFRQISSEFSYPLFTLYAGAAYLLSITVNMLYAKRKLGLSLINKAWWKDLGADIKKRAHENLEKQNKLDL